MLRRLDGWLSEFGVESISLELDGRPYVMSKGAGHATRALSRRALARPPSAGSTIALERCDHRRLERRVGVSARRVGRRVLTARQEDERQRQS